MKSAAYDPDGDHLPIPGPAIPLPGPPPLVERASDLEDVPSPSPDPLDADERDDQGPTPAEVPVRIARPMSVRPAPARLLFGHTRPVTGTAPTLLGLTPSKVQAQTISHLVLDVSAGGSVALAGTPDAMPGERFTVMAGAEPRSVVLPGCAGLYAWAVAGDPVVSVAVLGI